MSFHDCKCSLLICPMLPLSGVLKWEKITLQNLKPQFDFKLYTWFFHLSRGQFLNPSAKILCPKWKKAWNYRNLPATSDFVKLCNKKFFAGQKNKEPVLNHWFFYHWPKTSIKFFKIWSWQNYSIMLQYKTKKSNPQNVNCHQTIYVP